jgi:hypothetical protein
MPQGLLEVVIVILARLKLRPFKLPVKALALAIALLPGCSDDKNKDEGDPMEPVSGAITIEGIIISPSTPEPGDTITCTAVTTGFSAPGDFVKYNWSADGGVFMSTNQTSVQWIAPANSAVYTVSVSASNSASSSNNETNVYVAPTTTIVDVQAGEFRVKSSGDIVYVSSPLHPARGDFLGWSVRTVAGTGGANTEVLPGTYRAVTFNDDVTAIGYETPRDLDPFRETFTGLGNLTAMTATLAPSGAPPPGVRLRVPLADGAYVHPTQPLITYHVFLPDQTTAGRAAVDSNHVHTFNANTGTIVWAARGGSEGGANFVPSYSSDGNNLVFISDRSSNGQWELYSLAAPSGVSERDMETTPLQLTSTGGAMAFGEAADVNRFQWSPTQNLLAIIDVDDRLNIVPIDGSGARQVVVAGKVRDLQWSEDGQTVAFSTSGGDGGFIYTADAAGNATQIHSVPGTDVPTLMSFAPDGSGMVYAITRGGQDFWYEYIDLAGTTGLPGPIRVTSTVVVGRAGSYGGISDVRPRWHRDGRSVYVLLFNFFTARIVQVDLSGALPSP